MSERIYKIAAMAGDGIGPEVMKEVEKPLLEEVMIHCNWNQSEASKMLGINRGTLRTKLKAHKLI